MSITTWLIRETNLQRTKHHIGDDYNFTLTIQINYKCSHCVEKFDRFWSILMQDNNIQISLGKHTYFLIWDIDVQIFFVHGYKYSILQYNSVKLNQKVVFAHTIERMIRVVRISISASSLKVRFPNILCMLYTTCLITYFEEWYGWLILHCVFDFNMKKSSQHDA